jgi:hypothetical protein
MVEVEEWVNGELRQIQEDGTVKEAFEKFDREKVSETTRNEMANAIENKNWDKFCRKAFETLTGKTVEEAKN